MVRSTIPKLTLDGVFASKGLVAGEVVGRLGSVMAEYGYEILDALVTDIRLCEVAVESMSEINVAKRLKIVSYFFTCGFCLFVYLFCVGRDSTSIIIVLDVCVPFLEYPLWFERYYTYSPR